MPVVAKPLEGIAKWDGSWIVHGRFREMFDLEAVEGRKNHEKAMIGLERSWIVPGAFGRNNEMKEQ